MHKHTKKKLCTVPAAVVLAIALAVAGGCGDAQMVEQEKAYRQDGLDLIARGDYAGAVSAFDKALNARAGIVSNLEVDINFYKAYAQTEAGMAQDAIDTYTALIAYDSENADAYYLRGCLYMSAGDAKRAVRDFTRAADRKKDSSELYAGIYVQLMSAGMSAEASDYLEQGLKINGDSAAACLTRGRLYLESGDFKNAEIELKDALAQKEKEANLYLGDTAARQGNTDQAQAYYLAYAKDFPKEAKAFYALGQLAFGQGDYKQAADYFAQGLEEKNVLYRKKLWSGKIAAMEYQGDFAGARQEMEAYLENYPQDEEARKEYVFLKTR